MAPTKRKVTGMELSCTVLSCKTSIVLHVDQMQTYETFCSSQTKKPVSKADPKLMYDYVCSNLDNPTMLQYKVYKSQTDLQEKKDKKTTKFQRKKL